MPIERGRQPVFHLKTIGAQGEIRTPTPFRALPPQDSVSNISTTWANALPRLRLPGRLGGRLALRQGGCRWPLLGPAERAFQVARRTGGRRLGGGRRLIPHLALDQASRSVSAHPQDRECEGDDEERATQPLRSVVQEGGRLSASHHLDAGAGSAEVRRKAPTLP